MSLSRFDKVALATVTALGVTVGALSLASARIGPTVDGMTSAYSLDGVSVNSQIAISFTQPMKHQSAQRNFSISPRVNGDFSWSGNQLLFRPKPALRYSTTYVVRVGAKSLDDNGRTLFRPFERSFTTQAQHLLYVGTQNSEQGRLVLASVSGKHEPIGSDDGQITDFSVSFDQSLAVYVKRSAPGQHPNQVWLLSLFDNSAQQIFQHIDWSISQPRLSPDNRTIVFLATNVVLCQKYYGCYRDKSGPVVYLLRLGDRSVKPFHSSTDVPITNFIDFSPQGQLAYTDLGSALTLASTTGKQVIHIPNRGNSLEYAGFTASGDKAVFVGQTPQSSGGDILVYDRGKYRDVSRGVYDSSTPAFASTSSDVAYAGYHGEQGIEPIYGINVYGFRTGRTKRLTNEKTWSDWSPRWSLDDKYIAFVRSRPQEAMYMGSGEIWVVKSNGADARPLGGVGTGIHWVS